MFYHRSPSIPLRMTLDGCWLVCRSGWSSFSFPHFQAWENATFFSLWVNVACFCQRNYKHLSTNIKHMPAATIPPKPAVITRQSHVYSSQAHLVSMDVMLLFLPRSSRCLMSLIFGMSLDLIIQTLHSKSWLLCHAGLFCLLYPLKKTIPWTFSLHTWELLRCCQPGRCSCSTGCAGGEGCLFPWGTVFCSRMSLCWFSETSRQDRGSQGPEGHLPWHTFIILQCLRHPEQPLCLVGTKMLM